MDFIGSNILSIKQFQRQDIDWLFQIADSMQPYATRERITRVLEGAILSSMFFEPSTRTRISFGCAFNLLGGEVQEMTDVKTTSVVKGESLYDTARVLSGYSDIIVMRHPEAGSVAEFARASRVPVINAGDGDNEHPSQALLDVYTIMKEMAFRYKDIDNLCITLAGDLKHGRTVHSLCELLSLYNNISCKLISPVGLALPEEYVRLLTARGHSVEVSKSIPEGISDVDIIYVTRVQEERFQFQDEAKKYQGLLRLNQSVYTKFCEPNTVIMHPLPRDNRKHSNELDMDLNKNPNLAIFRQTDNGLLIRMALFAIILNVTDQIDRYSLPVKWYSRKNKKSL